MYVRTKGEKWGRKCETKRRRGELRRMARHYGFGEATPNVHWTLEVKDELRVAKRRLGVLCCRLLVRRVEVDVSHEAVDCSELPAREPSSHQMLFRVKPHLNDNLPELLRQKLLVRRQLVEGVSKEELKILLGDFKVDGRVRAVGTVIAPPREQRLRVG